MSLVRVIVLVWRRSKKLKADKTAYPFIAYWTYWVYGIMWLRPTILQLDA